VRFRVLEPIKAAAGNIRTLNATGDIEANKDQFGKACKSCRDNFRIRDK
jgi:cytochrome c556